MNPTIDDFLNQHQLVLIKLKEKEQAESILANRIRALEAQLEEAKLPNKSYEKELENTKNPYNHDFSAIIQEKMKYLLENYEKSENTFQKLLIQFEMAKLNHTSISSLFYPSTIYDCRLDIKSPSQTELVELISEQLNESKRLMEKLRLIPEIHDPQNLLGAVEIENMDLQTELHVFQQPTANSDLEFQLCEANTKVVSLESAIEDKNLELAVMKSQLDQLFQATSDREIEFTTILESKKETINKLKILENGQKMIEELKTSNEKLTKRLKGRDEFCGPMVIFESQNQNYSISKEKIFHFIYNILVNNIPIFYLYIIIILFSAST